MWVYNRTGFLEFTNNWKSRVAFGYRCGIKAFRNTGVNYVLFKQMLPISVSQYLHLPIIQSRHACLELRVTESDEGCKRVPAPEHIQLKQHWFSSLCVQQNQFSWRGWARPDRILIPDYCPDLRWTLSPALRREHGASGLGVFPLWCGMLGTHYSSCCGSLYMRWLVAL